MGAALIAKTGVDALPNVSSAKFEPKTNGSTTNVLHVIWT